MWNIGHFVDQYIPGSRNTILNYTRMECNFAPFREAPFIPFHYVDDWYVGKINQMAEI
jgi:hypothetical protein